MMIFTSPSKQAPFFLTTSQRSFQPHASSHHLIALQLRKAKQASQEAKKYLQETNKRVHRLQTTTSKHQKLATMAKTRCLKMYQIKKGRLYHRNLTEESKARKQHHKERTFEETQGKRLKEQVVKDQIRNKEEEKKKEIRTRVVSYKSYLQRELEESNHKISESCKRIVEEARREKSKQAEKRRQMEEAIKEFGRTNYMTKLKTLL